MASSAITLPPPSSIHKEAPLNSWHGSLQRHQTNPLLSDPSKDITVLGADIIAETFGELIAKKKIPPSKPLPLLGRLFPSSESTVNPPVSGNTTVHPSPLPTPTSGTPMGTPNTPADEREFSSPHPQQHGQFNQPILSPNKGEWNPRLFPPTARTGQGSDFNWQPNRSQQQQPPSDYNRQSPFSWRRSDYNPERHPQQQRDPRLQAAQARHENTPPLMHNRFQGGPLPPVRHAHPSGDGSNELPSLMGDQKPR